MDAAERWRVLRLHVEDQIPLAVLARETGISARTLQRWNRLYRTGGVASLDLHARLDKGVRRTSVETVAFIERLALTRPRPSLATLHRLAATDAQARELPAPSYATVREIVLFPQINRVLKINQLDTITDDVIEAAASILVIGN
ncbi:hypothetical protein PA27867_3880 (plasmid) [Cryobacterium arcticum]|uniref:Uncharacterized protein n=1 Tax=Cryobacterium arcticum TaxID=670052 RepID=A0A1B1BQE2_9MICO|nr:hypothetical protein PA27867_3880 [Cryobacterium arcticum]